jgi:hypothetical protein
LEAKCHPFAWSREALVALDVGVANAYKAKACGSLTSYLSAMKFSSLAILSCVMLELHSSNAFVSHQLPLVRRSQRSLNCGRIRSQITPNEEVKVAESGDTAKPIATGGTNYASLPKKEITPLFLIPSTNSECFSVCLNYCSNCPWDLVSLFLILRPEIE